MADVTGQVTVDTADQAVAEVVSQISYALMSGAFLAPITIGSISLETYFGSWALVAEYSNEFQSFELIVVALQEIPDITVSPSAAINAKALNVATGTLAANPPSETAATIADAWEAVAPLALTLSMQAAYGVTPTITGPYRKASPTGEIVQDTVIAVVELQSCFITLTLTGRFFTTRGTSVLGPSSPTPVQNQSTFVGALPGDLQDLVTAVEDITLQDYESSINQGAAAWSVKSRIIVT